MWNTSLRGRGHKHEHERWSWSCSCSGESWGAGAGELGAWPFLPNQALDDDWGGEEEWWLGLREGGDDAWAVLCWGVLDTREVQERRVVTHLKPSGWLVGYVGA